METEIPKEFNVAGIPVTFIISHDRKIALKHVGGADWSHEKVISYINELIDEKKVQGSEVLFFALRASQGRQSSVQPLAAGAVSLIVNKLCRFIKRLRGADLACPSVRARPRTRPCPRHRFTSFDFDYEDDLSITGLLRFSAG